MNKYGQSIIPHPCHFPRYSPEPKEKEQTIRERWDPVAKRLVRLNLVCRQPVSILQANGFASVLIPYSPAKGQLLPNGANISDELKTIQSFSEPFCFQSTAPQVYGEPLRIAIYDFSSRFYCIDLFSSNVFKIFIGPPTGTYVTSNQPYTPGDVFAIKTDGTNVKFYQNGTLILSYTYDNTKKYYGYITWQYIGDGNTYTFDNVQFYKL